MARQPIVVSAGEGPVLSVVGDSIRPLIAAEQSDGGFEGFDLVGPADSGPPPHRHPWDEAYVILEGEVETVMGDQRFVLRPGDVGHVPAGTAHTYRIVSDSAHFLVITGPQ